MELLARLLAGEIEALCVDGEGGLCDSARAGCVLLSGSFNPLHHGHVGMAEVAGRKLGRRVAFELSVCNPDKGVIDATEVQRRRAQFRGRELWLTRAATFAEKALLFPGAVFVVGVDTAARIVQPRFYGDSIEKMHHALEVIRAAGCTFLVAGRLSGDVGFVELANLTIPDAFGDLFDGIPGDEFRVDVSSTLLRARG